ncbi:hypothetical protein M422DRAFT_35431 [Sphaerobolus stellatus SS14]|uniref:SNF5-domain-containing protein n=1 Tax=Sphaerobolus stellatus (strain SS14) TaxID=990650 RepID=A0A0C9V897_SPHS4|nr:hypothetical protein M422DRAFT_35431 [Sphaerobolus stellatus SS14]
MEVEELRPKTTAVYDEESRILIKLDILVGSMKLDDQFEWDASCPSNSPEQFAELYAAELGLPGEFTTAIAHQIREQIFAYRKTMASGQVIEDEDLRPTLLPPVTRSTVARSLEGASAHMPLLNYMSDGEIERNERERDKELKRKRRTARGRVQTTRIIPDRTYRTPGIGFPESDGSVLQNANATPLPTTSRRAAAAAASVTIANMVASENGGSPIQGNLPNPIMPKEPPKKPVPPPKTAPQKLFKAPPVPPVALKARAKVIAPTPSTSLDPSKYKKVPPTEGEEPVEDDIPPPMPVKLTAKQMRDLEKEAKEKEYADGQHANMINGVWHCSNCGCPESIAVGRRKGPLGDKSQCGPCGKYYHRHRRPRPVEYHADEAYHLNVRVEAERAKMQGRNKKGGAAAAAAKAAPDSSASNAPRGGGAKEDKDDDEEEDDKPEPVHVSAPAKVKAEVTPAPPSKSASRPPDSQAHSRPRAPSHSHSFSQPAPPPPPAAVPSPADSTSSEEPPLALGKAGNAKVNGTAGSRKAGGRHTTEPPTPTPAPASIPPTPVLAAAVPPPPPPAESAAAPKPLSQAPSQSSPPQAPVEASPQFSHASVSPNAARPVSTAKPNAVKAQAPRPEWLRIALETMAARYPDDRFDVVLRKNTDPNAPPEWRVKCLDCPGKVYTPGPAETLVNFDVHLRNRNHRAKVNARLQGLQSVSPPQ